MPNARPSAAASPSLPSGWAALDEVLGGGFPAGLAELSGRGCASLAQGVVRQAQARGLPVAWVDGCSGFCPATADVDLEALTLVQPLAEAPSGLATRERVRRVLLAADVLVRSRAFGLVVLDGPPGRGAAGAWFRLARLVERSHAVFLLLHGGGQSLAGSAAGLVLQVRLAPSRRAEWEAPVRPDLEVCVKRHRARPGVRRVSLPAAPPAGP